VTEPDRWLRAGVVGRPHGLDGSFHVGRPVPSLLADDIDVRVGDAQLHVERLAGHARAPILRLEGCSERADAEALRGREILVARIGAPELEEDEWWAEDLEGCVVRDGDEEVGVTVQAILHYFPTKDDLMLGVLARRDEVDIQAVAPSNHAVGSAGEFIEIIGRLVARNANRPELIRLYTVLSAESLEPTHPAHQFFADRLRRAVATFAELAAQAMADLGRQLLPGLPGPTVAGRQREMIRAEMIRA